MKKQRIINMIKYELDIWKPAYPRNKKLLEKFVTKLIFEIKMLK